MRYMRYVGLKNTLLPHLRQRQRSSIHGAFFGVMPPAAAAAAGGRPAATGCGDRPVMRRRVLLGELEHETSTFNPSPTRLDMFRVREGEALLAEYGGTRTQLGGALQVLGSADIEVVPTYAANSVPGGLVSACDLGRLLDGLIGSIERALHIDGSSAVAGVLLSLHGAMAGIGEPDPEGELLVRSAWLRACLGSVCVVHVALPADEAAPWTDLACTSRRASAR
jgi:hypothetical protein